MADMQFFEKHYTLEDYQALPEGARVELIRGRFYNMAGPNRRHQRLSGQIEFQIAKMLDERKGDCEMYHAPFDVHLEKGTEKNHFMDTVVQPDISVICDKDKLTDQGCEGAPDWIIEIISPGNTQHDYVDKLMLYKQNGVREYWIVDPIHERVLVYYFEAKDEDDDQIMICGFKDKVPVHIYPDFEIDFSEMEI